MHEELNLGLDLATQLRSVNGAGAMPSPEERQRLISRLRAAQKQRLVAVAPGVYRTVGNVIPPDLILARLVPRGNGTYELVPAYECWVRLHPRIVRALGIEGQYNTIYRLGRAGFIEIGYIAPRTPLLNLCSWWGHLANVIEDPQFWDEETRRGAARVKLYRENLY